MNGSGVRPTHCTIYRSEENEVTVVPEMDARILIDGTKITGETNLTQGAMITIGNSNYLRFNNPAEAQLIRSAMGSNERISMPQIDFTQVQRISGRSSGSMSGGGGTGGDDYRQSIEIESFYESNINPNSNHNNITTVSMTIEKTKTAKNEQQQMQTQKHHQSSPTTTKKSCSSISSCSGAIDINGLQCPKVFTADLVTVNTPAKDVLGPKYANFARNLAENHRNEKNINNSVKNNQITTLKTTTPIRGSNISTSAGFIQNSSSNGCTEFLTKVNNVSSSLSRSTNSNHLQNQYHHQHNTVPAFDRYPKPGTYGGLQLFPMNGVNTEINNSSVNSSTQSTSCNSFESPASNHQYMMMSRTEQQNQSYYQKKISSQECERGVDEIVKICTEYDRQNSSVTSSPIVQNRIKTNGSLPRDKKSPFYHDLSSPKHYSSSSSSASSSATTSMSSTMSQKFFPEPKKPQSSAPSSSSSGYENVRLMNERRLEFGGGNNTGYENVVVGKYVPQSPRTKIRTTCLSPKKDSSFSNSSFSPPHHYSYLQQQSNHQLNIQSPKSPNDYDQLIQTFEEKLKMEMQAIEESSNFKPSTHPIEDASSTTKRSNKNINNLKLNLENTKDIINSQHDKTSPIEEGNLDKLQEKRKELLSEIENLKLQIADLRKQEYEVLSEVSKNLVRFYFFCQKLKKKK